MEGRYFLGQFGRGAFPFPFHSPSPPFPPELCDASDCTLLFLITRQKKARGDAVVFSRAAPGLGSGDAVHYAVIDGPNGPEATDVGPAIGPPGNGFAG